MNKLIAECCQGSRWAWSYRVLQFLVWVGRPKRFFLVFFWGAEIGGAFLVPTRNIQTWLLDIVSYGNFPGFLYQIGWHPQLVKIQIHPCGGFNSGYWKSLAEKCFYWKELAFTIFFRELFKASRVKESFTEPVSYVNQAKNGMFWDDCCQRGVEVYLMPTMSKWSPANNICVWATGGPLVSPGTLLMAEVKWEISNCCWRFCLFCPSES